VQSIIRVTLFATIVMSLVWPAVAAELKGRVTTVDGQPIAGARVEITADSERSVATTDASGWFAVEIGDEGAGPVSIVVSADGRVTTTFQNVDPGSPFELGLPAQRSFVGEIEVTGLRATIGETPVTVSTVGRVEIERDYWAQDVPVFLDQVPGFYAYNDSGNGIGYSYFFLRGFDMRRTAVSLNGVPLNDAHSHGVFFIDLADFLATTGEIQVQRGVGTNLYGGSAIGGSVELTTRRPLAERRLRLSTLAGSHGTAKLSLEFDTGLMDDSWAATFRYSRVSSDGYREQSWVEMWNYYAALEHYGRRSTLRLLLFGGPEDTHLAYEGIPKAYLDGQVSGDRRHDRRHNPLTYSNEIDHFFQPHYQLHHSFQISDSLVLQNTFFFFEGEGYFEQFKSDRWMPEYDLPPYTGPDGEIIDTTDLVRRREVDEWDGGWIPYVEWQHGDGRGMLQAGAAFRFHSGRHHGFTQWAQYYPPTLPPNHSYYDYELDKRTVQPFIQESWSIDERWNLLAGLTYTSHRYDMGKDQRNGVELSESFSYLLPRLGVTFRPNNRWSLYANVSRGGREPAFRDIYDPQSYWSQPVELDPEELTDSELGASYQWATGRAALNLYWLDFDNAIVWAGGLDNNGAPVTANGAVTDHRGIELELDWQPRPRWGTYLSLSLARHVFDSFTEYDYDGNAVDHSGNRIAGSADVLASLRLTGGLGPVDGFLQFRHVGSFFLDNTEDMRKYPEIANDPEYIHRVNEPSTVADLGISADVGPTAAQWLGASRIVLRARVNNITDELYTTFGYFDGVQPVWIPAATRNAYVGLDFEF